MVNRELQDTITIHFTNEDSRDMQYDTRDNATGRGKAKKIYRHLVKTV